MGEQNLAGRRGPSADTAVDAVGDRDEPSPAEEAPHLEEREHPFDAVLTHGHHVVGAMAETRLCARFHATRWNGLPPGAERTKASHSTVAGQGKDLERHSYRVPRRIFTIRWAALPSQSSGSSPAGHCPSAARRHSA